MATIFETFEKSVGEHIDRDAVGFLHQEQRVTWTYPELLEKVNVFADNLLALGFKKGDRVALLMANGPYWPVIDLGIAKNGMVFIPIHTVLTVVQIQKILAQSRAQALILGAGVEPIFEPLLQGLPECVSCLILAETHPVTLKTLKSLKVMEMETLLKPTSKDRSLERGHPKVEGDDLSTIIFTSGTTGEMKGVMLTHTNLVDSVLVGNAIVGASKEEVLLSVLPLSHAFERNAGLFGPLFYGAEVNYGRGITHLVEDINIFRPTRINVVPRLLEKMEAAIREGIKGRSALMYRIFNSLLNISIRRYQLRFKNHPLAILLWFPDRFGEILFYKKIRRKFGGRLHRAICGGAPIDPAVVEFFLAIGINAMQGYGLTEVSPTVAVNPYNRNKPGTVGVILGNLQVKIGDKDEILVKGSSLMNGYENNEQATREAIDEQGWFHTGDQGHMDEEGYLSVKGRVKELIVTSYGKNIIPSVVEQALEKSPLILQAAVFGHGKHYLGAILVLDEEKVRKQFSAPEFQAMSWEDLSQHPKVHDKIREEIAEHLKDLPQHEHVKKFKVFPQEFTQANDYLTPTLKLKRNKIAQDYAKDLQELW